jgi:hypothetical protein
MLSCIINTDTDPVQEVEFQDFIQKSFCQDTSYENDEVDFRMR